MPSRFKFDHPDEALDALAGHLATVGVEKAVEDLVGRTLATDVVADRDSPAADVSAMDGYAIRLSDLKREDAIPISGESAPGTEPPGMTEGAVIRIFTGAIVPEGCQAVLKREDTQELDGAIRLGSATSDTAPGEHIRRAGENARKGQTVLERGVRISPATVATMANFGAYHADVFEPVRVGVITSGNEVGLFQDARPQAWQLRNSNRFSIVSMLQQHSWIEVQEPIHCRDEADILAEQLTSQLERVDAVIMTGGVSMGDYDYVPDVVRGVGGEIVFHGLPIRPGKPILGAATVQGKLILGLPGNPVSATVGCRRFALPLLARINGQSDWHSPSPVVRLAEPDDKSIPLHWMRLVRLHENGMARVVASQGSGDLVSLGHSTGFVELPPGASGEGPWPYQPWA